MSSLLPAYVGLGITYIGFALAVFRQRWASPIVALGATIVGFGILWWRFDIRSVVFAGLMFAVALVSIIGSAIEERRENHGERP